MKVVSELYDSRINSQNLLVELSIKEYLDFAREIIHKNDFQRRRVRSSKTIYSLLQADLRKGCIIPPIVLALTTDAKNLDSIDRFSEFLLENRDHVMILDGLQRTYTIIDLVDELKALEDKSEFDSVVGNKIRAEFYIGLNRIGILYRMLTLNTGQTPMSLRQQIEILYLDYISTSIDNIDLVREIDEQHAMQSNQYNFRDIIEGFNSYLERNEFPIERADILDNIQGLEKLAKENAQTDLFESYLRAWHGFVTKITELCDTHEISQEFLHEHGESPFGKNAQQIFKKAQAVSGFGAAIGHLIDFGLIENFESVMDAANRISVNTPINFLDGINRNMDWIRSNTKKIGNAQRSYFQYFFREIFNHESDCYLHPECAVDTALRKFQSQNI